MIINMGKGRTSIKSISTLMFLLILIGCGDNDKSDDSDTTSDSSVDEIIETYHENRPQDIERQVYQYDDNAPAIEVARDLGATIPVSSASSEGVYQMDAMAVTIGGRCHVGRGAKRSEWGIKKGEAVKLDVAVFKSDRFASKRAQWDATVRAISSMYRMDPNIIHGIITQESGYNPQAVNKGSGATGMMQIMPGTQKTLKMAPGDALIAEKNIDGGTRYFRDMMKTFKGNVSLALAAYNAGPGFIQWCGDAIPPFKETQGYVRNITGYANLYSQTPNPSEPK